MNDIKNVIMIICDSLIFEEGLIEEMKSLQEYKTHIYNFTNYFAEAPFTEAAIIPIISSSNVLDYDGYLNNLLNRPRNINTTFKKNGFETYNTMFLYPNSISFFKDVDKYTYLDTPSVVSHFTAFRLKYYTELNNKSELSEDHLSQLNLQLINLFKMVDKMYTDFDEKSDSFNLLRNYTMYESYLEDNRKEFERVKHIFKEDSNYFISELLNGSYPIFSSKDIPVIKSKEFKQIENELNKFIKRRAVPNLIDAIKNNSRNNSLQVLKYLLKDGNKSSISSIKEWIVRSNNYGKEYSFNRLSAKVTLDNHLTYLRDSGNKKTFSYVHLNECHNPFNFLSYELEDVILDFSNIKNNPDDTFYNYSKKYLDHCLSEYLETIDNEFGLEETMVIITADHGSSNTSKVYRDVNVMNFYDESYHIPLYIINKNLKNKEIVNLGSSKQLSSTILDVLGIDDLNIDSESILRNDKDFVIFEYFGPGTPDYTRRNKLFCVRSNTLKVEYEVYINKKYKITAIYDLQSDPKELNNLYFENYNVESIEIQRMNSWLENRLESLVI